MESGSPSHMFPHKNRLSHTFLHCLNSGRSRFRWKKQKPEPSLPSASGNKKMPNFQYSPHRVPLPRLSEKNNVKMPTPPHLPRSPELSHSLVCHKDGMQNHQSYSIRFSTPMFSDCCTVQMRRVRLTIRWLELSRW